MWQKAKNIYHLLVASLFNLYYQFPARKLTVIGVTGTSGKTTTTHMIYEVLKHAGYKVSMLSTIQGVIGGRAYDTGFHVTTPDPHMLPKFFKMAYDYGDKYFVLEVSSHALDQNRIFGIPFKIGVLTTLAHEHLDYHKTFQNYANAKFKLLSGSQAIVVPENGIPQEIVSKAEFKSILKRALTFGILEGVETQKKWKFHLRLSGEFNIKNALAAAAVGKILKVPDAQIKKALEDFDFLPGRVEEISTSFGFRIIIDFAHKPDALQAIMEAARSEVKQNGRVITMFGAASERDMLKRPMMGEISARFSEITILTDEDPRFENSMKIINEIALGCEKVGGVEYSMSSLKYNSTKKHIFFKIPNRAEAIQFIIGKIARKGDLILLCGKGHEKSMSYQGVEKPWSEHDEVKKALKNRSNK